MKRCQLKSQSFLSIQKYLIIRPTSLSFPILPFTVHTKLGPIALKRARVMRHHLIPSRRRLPLALLQDLSCFVYREE